MSETQNVLKHLKSQ